MKNTVQFGENLAKLPEILFALCTLITLAASDRNCGDHSLVNKYSSYDKLRHYKLENRCLSSQLL
jgi:hypothetical protein